MSNDAAPFLDHTRKESRDVFKSQERNVERIAGSNKACCLDGRIDIKTTGEHFGLVPDHAHGGSVHAGKTDDDVVRIRRKEFHKDAIIHDFLNDLHHVVGFVRVVGDHVLKRVVESGDGVAGGHGWGVGHVVVWHVGQQRCGKLASVFFVIGDERSNT